MALSRLGTGNYRNVITEILKEISGEVDSIVLRELKPEVVAEVRHARIRDIFAATTFRQLYALILQDFDNDLKASVLAINRMIVLVHKNLSPALVRKMKSFTRRLTQQQLGFKLGEECEVYGRVDELKILRESVDRDELKLVNVWGQHGFGKSYIVKNLASRMFNWEPFGVEYTDCSGLQTLSCLFTRILVRLPPQRYSKAVAKPNELLGLWLRYLEQKYQDDERVIIVLDNLSEMLVKSSSLCRTLIGMVDYLQRKDIKVTFITTANSSLANTAATQDNTRFHRFIKDIHVSKMSSIDAQKFFTADVSKSLPSQVAELWNLGHPFSLILLNILADRDVMFTSQLLESQQISDPFEWIQQILSLTFNQLTKQQQRVLLTVAMFEGEAQLGAVHQIMGSSRSSDVNEFCEKIQKDFNTGFWLSFSTSDVAVERFDETLLHTSHSLVKQFLLNFISLNCEDGTSDEYRFIRMVKENFIHYHINILVEVGKNCIENPEKSCRLLMRNKTNITQAFKIISSGFGTSLTLLSTPEKSPRSSEDIGYLYLCLYQNPGYFEEHLVESLEQLVTSNRVVASASQYFWTLFRLVLVAESKWKVLESVVQDGSSLASHLCKSLNIYTRAVLASHLQEIPNADVYDKLSCALKEIRKEKRQSERKQVRNFSTVTKYFSILIRLSMLSAAQLGKAQPSTAIKKLCEDANKDASYVEILKPLVFKALGTVCGNKEKYCRSALNHYKKMQQGSLQEAAECMINLTEVSLERGLSLINRDELKQHIDTSIKIIERNSVLCSLNYLLFKALVLKGDSHYQSAKLYHQTHTLSSEKEELKSALVNLERAYNLLHLDDTFCSLHLAENVKFLERLKDILSHILSYCRPNVSPETLQQVTSTLQTLLTQASENSSIELKISSGSSLDISAHVKHIRFPEVSSEFAEATTTSVQETHITDSVEILKLPIQPKDSAGIGGCSPVKIPRQD
ncbi:hypothetical protein EB796_013750 [Bugula neritina]|uniref:Uncharacterized protein n=1 Tax=Bugula neritina TaxID=10212 RepID=A0A7J7JNJ4_BUGNE|nr:hypothetical protein EB796_013750 [Bugula neritina]